MVVQDSIRVGFGKVFQDFYLKSLELVLAPGDLQDEVVSLLLHLGGFIDDHVDEHLLLKAIKGDSEVDNGDLDTDFWEEMRVRKLGGDEELEPLVIDDRSLSEVNLI